MDELKGVWREGYYAIMSLSTYFCAPVFFYPEVAFSKKKSKPRAAARVNRVVFSSSACHECTQFGSVHHIGCSASHAITTKPVKMLLWAKNIEGGFWNRLAREKKMQKPAF